MQHQNLYTIRTLVRVDYLDVIMFYRFLLLTNENSLFGGGVCWICTEVMRESMSFQSYTRLKANFMTEINFMP